jgi:hypothetical protein
VGWPYTLPEDGKASKISEVTYQKTNLLKINNGIKKIIATG